jgi:hypothetical protein
VVRSGWLGEVSGVTEQRDPVGGPPVKRFRPTIPYRNTTPALAMSRHTLSHPDRHPTYRDSTSTTSPGSGGTARQRAGGAGGGQCHPLGTGAAGGRIAYRISDDPGESA